MRESFLTNFNLLVGCPRNRELAAQSEVRYFIGDLLSDTEIYTSSTNIPGLITCYTSLNPFDVIHSLREFAIENPYQFRFAIRFTPLEYWGEAKLASMIDAISYLLPKIDEKETFRITVRRRHAKLSTMEVITGIADRIPRKVNLDEPDKTVWIEIIEQEVGMSILNEREDILSIKSKKDVIDREILNL